MASDRADRFAELDITKDELNAIGAALKDKDFVELLNDYCNEVTDPENVKTYQNEMTILEKERGNDVTFINPEAGYVIKTSVEGNRKAYINICYNENVGQPSSEQGRLPNGEVGRNWQIPHMLSQPRDDFAKNDKTATLCTVYDVIFHPYTLFLASKNVSFRDMVTQTSMDSVENKFGLNLDRKNVKYLKMKFKGSNVRPPVIRKPIENFVKPEDDILDQMYPPPPVQNGTVQKKKENKSQWKDDPKSLYTTPRFHIKQRTDIDFQDYRQSMTCKMNTAIPTELIIDIDLPLLNSTSECQLDVTKKSLQLISEKPAKYKLEIQLPYSVNEQNGNAKFDRSKRKLCITLPVIRQPTPVNFDYSELKTEDSGVDSDEITSELITEISSSEHKSEIVEFRTRDDKEGKKELNFLDGDIEYQFPEFTVNVFKNIVAFTLHVKNVEPVSVSKKFIVHGLYVKFTSVSTGFYPIYYASCFKFPTHTFNPDDVSIETWDNNVIIQIPICDEPLTTYLIGLNESELTEHTIGCKNDSDESSAEEILVSTKFSDDSDEVTVDIGASKESISIDIPNEKLRKASSYSESSGDELSLSQSPSSTKAKGILKRRSRTLNRSVSESSVDDMPWSNSLDGNLVFNIGSETCIPEEEGRSGEDCVGSLKKTVRFNDNVSKQVFRMNSSILGQKKKNQRKNRNKKRSQERRFSESELSETEDKKEQFRKKQPNSHDRRAFSESELSESEQKEYVKKSTLKQHSTKKERTESIGSSDDIDKINAKRKNDSNKTCDIDFKSDLIFDLDI